MLSSILEGFLASADADLITDIFLCILFLFFALSCYFRRAGKQDAFTQYTPTLLTTTGILGTFFGIVAGLLAFDVTEIDGSIQGLLSGMKTAFLTSLIGMLLSISYKLLGSTKFLSPRVSQQVTDDQIGVSDIYRVMIEQRDNISALNQAVGGGDESSLTGQLKLLRSDFNDADKQSRKEFDDFQEKLWIKLQDFADMMSRSATEQVINALKDVIVDFNEKLTEQFGDNFKELNAAVKECNDPLVSAHLTQLMPGVPGVPHSPMTGADVLHCNSGSSDQLPFWLGSVTRTDVARCILLSRNEKSVRQDHSAPEYRAS